MAIYEYQAKEAARSCDHCRAGFELRQRMAAAPVALCPRCGNPVVRKVSVPRRTRPNKLSSRNIAEHGFTKYERRSDGTYERTAGREGPKTLGRNED